jgi:Uma2 family endonuclease
MTALPKHELTVPEFLEWAGKQNGKYELVRGEIFAMAREGIQHARVKRATADALTAAIKRAGLPCESFIDGPGVAVANDSYYVPDVTVHCGERLPGNLSLIPDPVILVEVVSPSTERYDLTVKLIDYFALPSLQHYLVLDLKRRLVLHHRRGEAGAIPTVIIREGTLALDLPGLTLALAELFVD